MALAVCYVAVARENLLELIADVVRFGPER